jgi:serine/threonine protein kinase
LHSRNIFHADIKPDNILLRKVSDENGERIVCCLSDFGLSRRIKDPIIKDCGVTVLYAHPAAFHNFQEYDETKLIPFSVYQADAFCVGRTIQAMFTSKDFKTTWFKFD